MFIINKVKAVDDNEESCEENIMEAEENKDKETIVDNCSFQKNIRSPSSVYLLHASSSWGRICSINLSLLDNSVKVMTNTS